MNADSFNLKQEDWIHLDTVKNVECLRDQEKLDGTHHPDGLHISVDNSDETLPVQGRLLGARWCMGAWIRRTRCRWCDAYMI